MAVPGPSNDDINRRACSTDHKGAEHGGHPPETDRLAGSFLNNGNLIALAEAVQRRMPMLAGNRSFTEAKRIMREQVAAALAKLTAITPAALAR